MYDNAPPSKRNRAEIILPCEDELMNQTNLVKTDTIASLFKLTVRRVQQLTQEGILKTVADPTDKGKRKYDLVPTIQAYIDYLQAKAYGRSGANNEVDEVKRKKIEVDTELRASQVELHRFKTSIALGEYLPIEEVELDYKRFFVYLKKMVSALAPRTAAKLTGKLEPLEIRAIEKEIDKEMKAVLRSFVIAGVSEAEAAKTKKKKDTPDE